MAVISIKNKTKSGSLLVGNTPYELGDYESIATSTLTSDTSSLTFSSIPGTYQHLQLRFMAKGNNAGDLEYLGFRLNGFTGDYYWHQIYGEGSGTPTGTYFQQSFMRCFISGNNGTNMFGVGVTDILDYTNTNKFKTLKTFSGYDLNGSGMATVCSGLYSSTSAVTSITVLGVNNTLKTGTTVALYGLKG